MTAHDPKTCDSCRSAAPCPEWDAHKREPRAIIRIPGGEWSLAHAELLGVRADVDRALASFAYVDSQGSGHCYRTERHGRDIGHRCDGPTDCRCFCKGCLPRRSEAEQLAFLRGVEAERERVAGAIMLPGWTCACGGWTGLEKGATECMHCGKARSDHG